MRILLVEDEEKLAEAISIGLKNLGYAVDIVSDGEKAWKRLSIHHIDYDLVILDLMLPGLSGAEICARARKCDITTPILILTARNETENKVTLLESGADDYLVKPFAFEELRARILALSRRAPDMKPTVLSYRDIELDPAKHTVTKSGTPVPLTLKEFSLLEFFMQQPDKAINREELLSHLWDFNYDSFSNVVDVHIKNLRRKLGSTKDDEILEAVRGVGYRLKG